MELVKNFLAFGLVGVAYTLSKKDNKYTNKLSKLVLELAIIIIISMALVLLRYTHIVPLLNMFNVLIIILIGPLWILIMVIKFIFYRKKNVSYLNFYGFKEGESTA